MYEYFENTMPSGMSKIYIKCDNEICAEERMLDRQYQVRRDIINHFKEKERSNEKIRDNNRSI